MVAGLLEDPNRRFIYVEQAFFQRWWEEQTPAKQGQVRDLVGRGQLEFINGGWSMHDEACPSFVDMLDNTALGQRLIFESFGVVPKTTWQIDPFGHSAFQGSMLSSPLAGVNGVYVARMDYQDINQRQGFRGTEMFWAPSPSQPMQGGVLGFLPFWYYAPAGFDFGGDDGTQPVMDDPALEDYNVPDVVARFNALIDNQLSFTAGQDTMIMMATDFSGENAPTCACASHPPPLPPFSVITRCARLPHVPPHPPGYRNIDKLLHYVNGGDPSVPGAGKYNLLYSTPSIYTAAKVATTPLPLRTEDVMPYADGAHAFWSGYFSSRPALKGYVRDSSAVFQAAKQLQALTGGAPDMTPANPLYLLERAMGVTQHHDAVSGTSKQHVANDYALRLAKGRLAADPLIGGALAAMSRDGANSPLACDLANVTICPPLEAGAPALLYVWNQQSSTLDAGLIRVPVGLPGGVASYAVAGPDGAALPAQLLPLSATDAHLRGAYYNYSSTTPVKWLAFAPTAPLPAMGFSVFFLTPSATERGAPLTVVERPRAPAAPAAAGPSISNGIVTLTFDPATGLLASYADAAGTAIALTQTFAWYNSSTGNQTDDHTGDNDQCSGAYIFRPNGTLAFPVPSGPVAVDTTSAAGPVVWEARQTFAPWATQVVRLFAGSSDVEFEFTVGPIPFADGLGKEVITRYTSADLGDSAGAWVSDSNGRDALLRRRNARQSFNYTVYEPVAGNFVPVNLFTALSSPGKGLQLSVVTDRTQAGSSMADGSLELMVHRRIQADDSRGVGEPHNETGLDGLGLIVRGVHTVRVDKAPAAGRELRRLAARSLFKPLARVARNSAVTPAAWLGRGNAGTGSGLAAPLPPNVHLVTVHSLGPGRLLLRLAHMFATGEDAALSAPVSVDLSTLFAGFRISSATEMMLGGAAPLTTAPTTTYQIRGGGNVTLPVVPPAPAGPGLTITLTAMQIRTFECQV